jgi:hypothetical protein
LPTEVKVILLADRGFGHTDLMRALSQPWHWHYRIRLKKDTWVWRCGHGWRQLQNFHFQRGEALCWHHVYLHKEARYGPVHLAFGRNSLNGECWAVVSDELTTRQTFADYGLRCDIEETFLDDQSNGWNVQKSGLRSVSARSRLWLILARSTLYVTALGTAVVVADRRRWVDTHWLRGNSYFRIGWEWGKAARNHGWRLMRRVCFRAYRDPDPVMASRQQHQKRLCRLEFLHPEGPEERAFGARGGS